MESDDEINISSERSEKKKKKFDYLENNHDCLTDAFISIYENSLWFIKLFFQSLCQVLLLTKEELHDSSNDTNDYRKILSLNNSADEDCPQRRYRKLPRHRSSTNKLLPNSNSRQKISSKLNQTRVIVRSMSNQNLNHTSSAKEKPPSNTLGTINSHIIVAPVDSSRCANNQLTNPIDWKQAENGNLREQLADALCRRAYEPLTFINRGICCGHCRPCFCPTMPFQHSDHYLSPSAPQQELDQEKEFSQKSEPFPSIEEGSGTQSIQYSASPHIESQSIHSPVDEFLSSDTTPNSENTSEQNHSVLSFPEHDTPPSQISEKLIDNDSQLKLNAQILVDDSIQNAQEKYQKMLQMNNDKDPPNNTLATIKQIVKNKSKSASLSNESDLEKLSDNHALCQELCSKLNLSDSNQIAEIMRVLASNVPHALKEPPPADTPLINNSNINKGNDNNLCSQLLLHPPFKPKRLIHLCPDGSIQVLSAIDENSSGNKINNQEQYRLNYSNSALIPAIQHPSTLTNESSLTVVDVETNFNHMLITESTSTQLSLQQKQTLRRYKSPQNAQPNNDDSKIISQDDPIVQIDLDLNDETMEDDENSIPEIFFKRIIAPECSLSPKNDDKIEVNNVRRRNQHKSRHNRSRSHINKKTNGIER